MKTKQSLKARGRKPKSPKKVKGITPMQSSDTLAFMEAYGRLGGRHEQRPNRAAEKRNWKADL